MATNGRNGLGAAERLQVTLPAPCIGHPLLGNVACPNEGTLIFVGVMAKEDGSPMPFLCTSCPEHATAVGHWLQEHSPDPVDRWATRTFFEHAQIFEDSGLDWHRLTRVA